MAGTSPIQLCLKAVLINWKKWHLELKKLVVHAELLSPKDIENEYGITGGQWHHGELTFDQFLMLRPIAGMAQYKTPIESLYYAEQARTLAEG